MVRSALQKAKSSLIKEQCAALERAQMTIAKYKETLSFQAQLREDGSATIAMSWLAVHRVRITSTFDGQSLAPCAEAILASALTCVSPLGEPY
ncbi:hypothetical protein BHE74_00031604 [Ensete ventricosum]|nr:hypothetical protein BHE74_00031604 [Ensete ventricosum]